MRVEAHGGYLCRVEGIGELDLLTIAKEALQLDGGDASDVGLQLSVIPRRKIVRFAWDGPFTYGRKGARWYETHHALARLLSVALRATMHAYVFDPDELEEVTGYGNGRRVGGERLVYADAEWPEEDDSDSLDDRAFEKMKEKWPIGHLAYVFGVSREELLSLPRAQSLLLPLDSSGMELFRQRFEALLTPYRSEQSVPLLQRAV